jgi:hypothetical protein
MMNLFSLTKTLQNRKIGFERIDRFLALIINGNKLVFNKEVKGGSGVILGIDIFPIAKLYHVNDFMKNWVALIKLLLQKLLRNMDGTLNLQ